MSVLILGGSRVVYQTPELESISIALNNTSFSGIQGNTSARTLTLTRNGGYSGTVSFAVSGLPTGTTAAFSPTTLSGGTLTTTVTLTHSGSADIVTDDAFVITASGSGVSDATVNATVTVAAPSTWDVNRPTFVSTLSDNTAFTNAGDLTNGGYTGLSAGGYTDSSAPYSPDKVARFVLNAGTLNGAGLGQRAVQLPVGTVAVYSVANFYFAPNYTVHDSNQKLLYAFHDTGQADGSWVFGIQPGLGESNYFSGTLRWNVQPQYLGRTMRPNVGTPPAPVRGQWYKVEILTVRETTAGGTDGICKVWIDGTLQFDFSDVAYNSSGGSQAWRNMSLNVYYGGNSPGHVVVENTYIHVDHYTVYSATTRS